MGITLIFVIIKGLTKLGNLTDEEAEYYCLDKLLVIQKVGSNVKDFKKWSLTKTKEYKKLDQTNYNLPKETKEEDIQNFISKLRVKCEPIKNQMIKTYRDSNSSARKLIYTQSYYHPEQN